jgi:glycosyltransferase involved in cell wall biosynthesis
MQLATRRRRNGAWVSTWETTHAWESALQWHVQRQATTWDCEAVLEIQDLAITDQPFFVYQDLSYDVLLARWQADDKGVRRFFRRLDEDTLKRRRDRQHHIYDRAAGLIAMSQWFADSLVRESSVPHHKVFLAYPGATSLAAAGQAPRPPRPAPRSRLLFLGTSFHVKGGDLAVAAVTHLRTHNPAITLTVAGPSRWPLAGDPPPGIDFVGRVPRERVARLLDEHDVLVMPSRLEGFGIVFVEALARGLPCIGRRAFAMPEIIEEGVTGGLIDSDDPAELARAIQNVLASDEIFAEVAARAGGEGERFTWGNTADTMLHIIRDTLA